MRFWRPRDSSCLLAVAQRLQPVVSCWPVAVAVRPGMSIAVVCILTGTVHLHGCVSRARFRGKVVPEPRVLLAAGPRFLGGRAALYVPPRGFCSPGRHRLCLGNSGLQAHRCQHSDTVQLHLS